ncbi:VWA domain-containing protein [Kouleothrix sp.]|uniref:VWA domain-containing protein n=1 Tax=Kouleothrix sp. TaxID=2779161 RepID=UPI00391D1E23
MPQLAFIFPGFLWLLLLLPLLWALALLAPRRLPAARFWASLGLRTLATAGLILALAGAQLIRPVAAVTTIFLLDGSDSIALSQRARAEAFVQGALGAMPAGDQAALVVFGQRALVERPPAANRALGQVAAQPGGGATNIEQALRLGLALLPNEGHARLVLLSDGGETGGSAQQAARLAAARGVPLDVVPLSGRADGLDAQISGVALPAAARAGQQLRMAITIDSSAATDARLVVSGPGGAPIASQPLRLMAGSQVFELRLPTAQPGFNRYVARVEAPGDARPANNAAEAYTFVSGPPRVLLIEGQPGVAASLGRALAAAGLDTTTVAAEQAPAGLAELSLYDAAALLNVPRRALAERTQAALSAYVHDLGRGLMMVGGDQSFGAGGWRGTPVEAALPVTMDIPSQVRQPAVGIVVLIDVSGSMGASENGRTKISLAAEGAQRIAALLRDEDELTVIMFDTSARQVVGPLPGSRRDEAIEALGQAHAGGGGIDMFDGLSKAAEYIRQGDQPVRHIITITDGGDSVQQEGARDLVRQLRAEHVTLTSVAVGDGKDVPFLRDIAQIGGGRTFLTDQAANLPALLVDEAQAVIEPYIVEQQFTPVRGAPHPILRGIDATPALGGYVVATPRPTAQVLLATPRGEPLLAAWQYGLGRGLAFTSDTGARWGAAWARWAEFPRFAAQLFGWLLPQQAQQNLALEASSLGAELVLQVHAQDALGRPLTGLAIDGRLLATDTISAAVALREVGPGEYRAALSGAPPGIYLAQLVARDARGQPAGALTAGVAVPLSAEYRSNGGSPALLEALAQATGGRLNIAPGQSFDANATSQGAVREIGLPLLWLALLLLPLDIALRRLLLARRQPAATLRWPELLRAARRPTTTQEQPASPRSVKRPNAANTQASELDQLREAQERARRRARGED